MKRERERGVAAEVSLPWLRLRWWEVKESRELTVLPVQRERVKRGKGGEVRFACCKTHFTRIRSPVQGRERTWARREKTCASSLVVAQPSPGRVESPGRLPLVLRQLHSPRRIKHLLTSLSSSTPSTLSSCTSNHRNPQAYLTTLQSSAPTSEPRRHRSRAPLSLAFNLHKATSEATTALALPSTNSIPRQWKGHNRLSSSTFVVPKSSHRAQTTPTFGCPTMRK